MPSPIEHAVPSALDRLATLKTDVPPADYFDNVKSAFSDDVTVVGSPDEDITSCSKPKAAQLERSRPPNTPTVQPTSWRPLLFRLGPLSGLIASAFCMLQVLISYCILSGSDGHPVQSWKYQPSVYLAILTAVGNKALSFAAVQGTVVSRSHRA
jgi:hypothetical protein